MQGYTDWFRSEIPGAFSKSAPEIDTLIIDLNVLLEEIFKNTFASRTKPLPLDTLETEFYALIPQKINDLVRTYLPKEVLFLALDGVVTALEMHALKQKSYYRSLTRDTEIVDSNGLLPGTDWMFKIKNQLSAFPTDATLRPYETVISHMTTPGSALEKILTQIRNSSKSSLIVCSDPERFHLLLLGSLLSPAETYLTLNGKEYISVDVWRKYLIEKKGEAAPDELVVLSLFLGSGLHPAIPSLSTAHLSLLWDAYQGFPDIFLAQDQGMKYIDWQVLTPLLSAIHSKEPTRLAEIALQSTSGKFKYPFTMAEQAIQNGKFYLNLFRAPWYRRALGIRDESLALTLMSLIGEPPTTVSALTPKVTQVQDMTTDYLITIGWLYLFLQGGKVYRSWMYRYHHAPLGGDIVAVAQNADSIYLYGYRGIVPEIPPLNLIQQLSAVLPYVSREILPVELQPLFDVDSPLFPLTPLTFIVEHEGKRSPREGTIIPFIDISKVHLSWFLHPVKTDKSRMKAEKEYIYHLSTAQVNSRKALIDNELAARRLAQERLQGAVNAREAQAIVPRGRGRGRGEGRGKAPVPVIPKALPKSFPKFSASRSPQSFRGSPRGSMSSRGSIPRPVSNTTPSALVNSSIPPSAPKAKSSTSSLTSTPSGNGTPSTIPKAVSPLPSPKAPAPPKPPGRSMIPKPRATPVNRPSFVQGSSAI